MASSNGMQTAADVIKKSPLADVHLDEVKETIEKELGRASHAVSRIAKKVEIAARENPRATAGVLLGVGALFGVLLHSMLRPAPTASEVLWKALGQGQVEKSARANPWAAAGVLVGAGALLGAALHAALRPTPSLSDSFRASLKNLRR